VFCYNCVDFATNEPFFATLVHYGSKSGTEVYCDTCHDLNGPIELIQWLSTRGIRNLIPRGTLSVTHVVCVLPKSHVRYMDVKVKDKKNLEKIRLDLEF
jgi:hypothetical protein